MQYLHSSSNVSLSSGRWTQIWVEDGVYRQEHIKATANSSGTATVTATPDAEYGRDLDSEGFRSQ